MGGAHVILIIAKGIIGALETYQKKPMAKFLALYMAPASVLEEWAKTDPEKRKEEEQKMQSQWKAWMQSTDSMVKETVGAGATKRVTAAGIADVKNDVMLYSIVEAPSHEVAAKLFEGHPHLQIPQSSIEVMPANSLPGMRDF